MTTETLQKANDILSKINTFKTEMNDWNQFKGTPHLTEIDPNFDYHDEKRISIVHWDDVRGKKYIDTSSSFLLKMKEIRLKEIEDRIASLEKELEAL